jgi:hypothetical protein
MHFIFIFQAISPQTASVVQLSDMSGPLNLNYFIEDFLNGSYICVSTLSLYK